MNPTVDEMRKILADLPGDAEVRIEDGAVIIEKGSIPARTRNFYRTGLLSPEPD